MRFGAIAATAASLVLTLGAVTSHAAVLAADDFSGYAPATPLNGLNGGSGFSGGYVVGNTDLGTSYLNQTRNGAPLSYPNYTTVGGTYANLASGYGGPTFNYVQRQVDVAGSFSSYNDGTRVGADGTKLYGSFAYNNVGGASFYIQGSANTFFGLPTTGSDSLIIYTITYGAGNADTIRIYNNPNLTTFDEGTAVPTSVVTGDLSFQSIGFVTPGDTNEVRFDSIVLGSTLSDVAPVAVPEPASIGLIGMTAVGLLARRRRAGAAK